MIKKAVVLLLVVGIAGFGVTRYVMMPSVNGSVTIFSLSLGRSVTWTCDTLDSPLYVWSKGVYGQRVILYGSCVPRWSDPYGRWYPQVNMLP